MRNTLIGGAKIRICVWIIKKAEGFKNTSDIFCCFKSKNEIVLNNEKYYCG